VNNSHDIALENPTMQTQNPIANLTNAEAMLVNVIDATTAQVNATATTAVDAALKRLSLALQGAESRINSAVETMKARVGALVSSMAAHIAGTAQAVEANKITLATIPVEPASTNNLPPWCAICSG
jgi:hypothetical protein